MSWFSSDAIQKASTTQIAIALASSTALVFILLKYLSRPKALRNHRIPEKMKGEYQQLQ